MTLLILGLLLWVAAHTWKRVSPGTRADMGDRGRLFAALAIIASVVLMVIGYRAADGAVYWGRAGWSTGVNNLLMLVAFYIYAVGAPKPGKPRVWLGRKIRHPQLIGFSIWAVAHLLVNGDVPSFVLFGGLLVWALAEIVLINRAEPEWTPPPHRSARKEFIPIVAAIVIYAIVAAIHILLGYNPFG
ncbi:hypothetical protein AN189_05485 [Loktanella sp. 3ANDIMAR09]|uniref:NnrU family protein n=1 Tax=Loktanella sp. 3ANDIMAR09 TaxID=1225657 RepID=UPI0006FC741E|nr:NnrU family protein [Loktanella sp. 3ANDIMAR09]KQI69043.1 hypothetical protein AN189_05485 [Loktanella sp. 3ANDIMAR09]